MVSEAWEIREATAHDSAGLERCMVAAYSSYQSRFGDVRLPPLDVDYSAEIEHFPTWVIDYGDEIVGGVIMAFKEDHAVVSNIAIHPDCQGRGLGSELMGFAEAIARERNLAELRLTTHALLSENVSLYIHLGWTEVDRDNARVYMRKSI